MCKFFSIVSDAKGNFYYFDWKQRQQIIQGKIKCETADSHTSIADFYGFKGQKEDKLNKYEYNPFTKQFTVDQINTFDDSKEVEKFCKKLDFKEIVPVNFDKKIINPFKDRSILEITDEDIELLKQWASVRASVSASVGASVSASVRDSVRASVGDSVGYSVWDSVWDSVWASVRASVSASVSASVRASGGDSVRASVGDSVWASVWDSVWDSVGDSVGASVGYSVWDSVGDSVRASISPFVDIKYKYDFSSAIKLWEKGLVPSFDGKIWRLHGKGGKILKEIDLKKVSIQKRIEKTVH